MDSFVIQPVLPDEMLWGNVRLPYLAKTRYKGTVRGKLAVQALLPPSLWIGYRKPHFEEKSLIV